MRKGIQALTPALRASLKFLVEILTWPPPRRVDFATVRNVGIAYADAFFEMDGTKHRPADSSMSHWTPQLATSFPNGWGVVVRCPTTGVTWYASGVVPTRILERFTLRRQHIFLLETLAQCLASWLLTTMSWANGTCPSWTTQPASGR